MSVLLDQPLKVLTNFQGKRHEQFNTSYHGMQEQFNISYHGRSYHGMQEQHNTLHKI